MKRSAPITVKPSQGGALLSALSSEAIGVANYDIKRNWRKYLDRELRSEGFVQFCPKMFDGVIPLPATAEDITLSIMLRHPNGRTAVIVGTATQIWRYAGLEDPLYVLAGWVEQYYYTETATAWELIGDGFAAVARRWEAHQVNGYLILNNASDLPVTYRLTDDWVKPIYELRELAIASVGTICIYNTCLFCFDLSQIKDGVFEELMAPVASAVDAYVLGVADSLPDTATINDGTPGVAGNVITASGSSFNSAAGFTGMEGRTIRMFNGVERKIVTVNSPTEAVLDGSAVLVEPTVKFFIPRDTAFNDYYYDFCIQPRYADLWPAVNFAATPANPDGAIGLRVWWDTGESATITGIHYDGISGDAFFKVASDHPILSGPCKLEAPNAYGIFNDPAGLDRVQWRSLWSLPDAPRRFGSTYPGTINPSSDLMTLTYPVKSVELNGGDVVITGMKSGNLSATAIYFDGLRFYIKDRAIPNFYQVLFDAAADAASAEAVAATVVDQTASTLSAAKSALDKATTALAAAPEDATLSQAVATASAAVDTAQSAWSAAKTELEAATKASDEADAKLAASEDVEAQLADSVSVISRSEDLQDDGSAILRALPLRNSLVIYKETCIFLCRQSGVQFVFSPPIQIPSSSGLFYRNTLIAVDGSYHLYAAEYQFCRFDMTVQVPVSVPRLQACQNQFFDNVAPSMIEKVFAADNALTAEIFFAFPSGGADRALIYEYEFDSMSTSSIPLTAGAMVRFPGSQESVFLMGGAAGKVWRYGLIAVQSRTVAGTASKAGTTITSLVACFSESDIGKSVRFLNGQRFGIVSFIDATHVTVVGSGTVSAQAFFVDPACYHYDGASYTSVLQSGGDAFKSESSYKKINRHELMVSSFSPDTEIDVMIRSGLNVNQMADRIAFTIVPPETLVAPLLEDYFLGDRLEVDGINNPVELVSRIFSISGIKSDSFGRRNA
jgi:hypothetical protein